MNYRILIRTAQAVSLLFSPFYLPVMAFIALFYFSYLSLLPLWYKAAVTGCVLLFTVLLPAGSIRLYRFVHGWTHREMGRRERRYVPFLQSIMCYAALLYLLDKLHMPRFMFGIIAGALAIQVVCAVVNAWLKVCVHSAAAGGIIGALLGFSLIFAFNPTYWLCFAVLMAGAVGTARLILRQQTLTEIGVGTLIGLLCGFCCVVFA